MVKKARSVSPPKLNKTMQNAGITQVHCVLTSGAVLCTVRLDKVDRMSRTNYRKLDERHSANIGERFDQRCVRNPVLRYLNGKLDSVDGRHTTDMLLDRDVDTATAEVHFGINNQQAARIFYEVAINTKRMDQWAAYNAALTGKYKFALDIKALMEEFGFTCPADEGYGNRNADIRSASPLYEAYQHDGEPFVRKLFTVLAAWRDRRPEGEVPKPCGKCEFLRGLIDFLQDVDTTDIDAVANRLTSRSPESYVSEASGYGERSTDRITRGHFFAAFRSMHSKRKAA